MVLEVEQENIPARSLYEKLGYRLIDRHAASTTLPTLKGLALRSGNSQLIQYHKWLPTLPYKTSEIQELLKQFLSVSTTESVISQ